MPTDYTDRPTTSLSLVRPTRPLVVVSGGESTPSDEEKTARQRQEEFLRVARQRFKEASEAEQDVRREALDDLMFYSGQQWPQMIEQDRKLNSRPCLVINRLPPITKQIINEQRQSRPAIQVNPIGDGADVDTAEVIQGLTRHIENNSDAEIAYDTAFEHATICGFGYLRVITDYSDPQSFDQEILIKRVIDPFSVYFDPTAQEPDYSDARYAFVVEDLTREQYKARYPDSEVAGMPDFRSVGDSERDWFSGEAKIRVAEYFEVREETRTIVALTDGTVVFEEDIPDGAQILQKNGKPLMRETTVRTVHWSKINAREVLEETEWPGQWIPIIPVLGDELIVDGRRKLVGIVRHAKDPQRQYNYQRSAAVEMVALAPKAPWIAAEGQIEGYEKQYEQANVRNIAVLPYKPKTVGNQLVPPPQRNVYSAPISDIAVLVAQSDNDLKATTGIYDASLGAPGPEQSGKAILARQREGDVANFNFIDNLRRSMKHLGTIILDLLPKIYDSDDRISRIIKPDGTSKTVTLNGLNENGKVYDLRKGKYDVTISVGPSYQSKRQEFVESALTLAQANPALWQIVGDLIVRHFDWPGAQDIADRMKKMLPPQLQEEDDPQKQQPVPPAFMQKFQVLMQQHEALTQQLEQATETINTKRLELSSKERIAAIQAQATLIAAELKANTSNAQALLMAEIQSINKRLELLHATETMEEEAAGGAQEPAAESQAQS